MSESTPPLATYQGRPVGELTREELLIPCDQIAPSQPDRVRVYRPIYRVPPRDAEGRVETFRDAFAASAEAIRWFPQRIPIAEWEERAIEFHAWDEGEAWHRLEYRLVQQGYTKSDESRDAIYARIDAIPI